MSRRSAIVIGTLLLAAAGGLLFPRCGEDVPEARSSRGPADGAEPPTALGLASAGAATSRAPAPPSSAPAPAPAPADPAHVPLAVNTRTRGFVVDEDGRPIAGATVVGEADVGGEIGPGTPVTTDAAGRFDIEVVNDDCATFTVTAPGFIPRGLTRQSRDAGGVVLRRDDRSRVRLLLSGDVAEGDRFRWHTGEPGTQEIAPCVWWERDSGGGPAIPPPKSWDSDAPELVVVGGVIELPQPFSPGVSRHLLLGDRASAGPIWIHAPARPETLDVPVRVLLHDRVEVLVTRAEAPVEKATVVVRWRQNRRTLGGAATDSTGVARVTALDLPDRSVEVVHPVWLSVELPDGADRVTIDIASAEAARDASTREREALHRANPTPQPDGLIRPEPIAWPPPDPAPPLPATGGVVGRIAAEAWPPLESGYVRAVRWTPDRAASAPPVPPVFAGLGSSPQFHLGQLPPGRWRLFLRCGAFVATSDGPVEVRAGETTDVGELPLRRGAVLSGRVVDAVGAPRAFTRVAVLAEARVLDVPAWTDPDGVYHVEGLWPGVWTVIVDAEGDPGFARGDVHVRGAAEHRLDLRPVSPR